MQTEHYMANMGRPGPAERLGLERDGDRADVVRQQVVSGPGPAQLPDDEAQLA